VGDAGIDPKENIEGGVQGNRYRRESEKNIIGLEVESKVLEATGSQAKNKETIKSAVAGTKYKKMGRPQRGGTKSATDQHENSGAGEARAVPSG